MIRPASFQNRQKRHHTILRCEHAGILRSFIQADEDHDQQWFKQSFGGLRVRHSVFVTFDRILDREDRVQVGPLVRLGVINC